MGAGLKKAKAAAKATRKKPRRSSLLGFDSVDDFINQRREKPAKKPAKPTTIDFPTAFIAVRDFRAKIARADWPEGVFVYMQYANPAAGLLKRTLEPRGPGSTEVDPVERPYAVHSGDLFATDWRVVE